MVEGRIEERQMDLCRRLQEEQRVIEARGESPLFPSEDERELLWHFASRGVQSRGEAITRVQLAMKFPMTYARAMAATERQEEVLPDAEEE